MARKKIALIGAGQIGGTLALLAGFLHNRRVLVQGRHGTGKSSLVKALLNEYAGQGLRLIDVSKERLADFPRIAAAVRNRRHRFILFMHHRVLIITILGTHGIGRQPEGSTADPIQPMQERFVHIL